MRIVLGFCLLACGAGAFGCGDDEGDRADASASTGGTGGSTTLDAATRTDASAGGGSGMARVKFELKRVQ